LARIGTVVQQKYRIQRLLGIGGMAAVFAATHRNGHRVAIKFLLDHLVHDPDVYRLFTREAYVANDVGHPGAVPVLDDDTDDQGNVFLVMPLLEGETLRARWERTDKRLPLAEVGVLMLDALDVLASAHAKSIVHRDLKPDNLFLTTKGDVRVLDFGIARRIETDGSFTTTGRMMGTPAFMPPEQALGDRSAIGPHSDLWALGATLFALLSGEFVHAADNASAQLAAAAMKPARSLGPVLPDLAPSVVQVVDKALALAPGDRWRSAREMSDALAASLEEALGEPVAQVAMRVRTEIAQEFSMKAAAFEATRSDEAAELCPDTEDARTRLERKPPSEQPRAGTTMPSGSLARTPPPTSPLEPSLSPAAVVVHARHPAILSGRAWAKLAVAVVGLTVAAEIGMHVVRPLVLDKASPVSEADRESDTIIDGALQLWTDGAFGRAREEFARAAMRDPSDPRPHVLLVAASEWIEADAQEHARRATPLRAHLRPVEAALFDAIQPLVANPPDLAASTRRFDELVSRYPKERVVRLARAYHYLRTRDTRGALAFSRSPDLPGNVSLWLAARAHLLEGDVEAARPLLRACIDASPGAIECLWWLGTIDANEGKCADAEASARKFIAANPRDEIGYQLLARAVMGATHSTAATRSILEMRWEHVAPPMRDVHRTRNELWLHVYDGDFQSAYRDLDAWDAAVKWSIDGFERAYPLVWRTELDRELGRTHEAADAAQSFAFANHAWLPSPYYDTDMGVARALYLTFAIPREQFLRDREAAVEKQRAKAGYYSSAGIRWMESYVETIREPEDVDIALAAKPSEEPLIDPIEQDDGVDATLGWLYLLANRPDDAIPFLRRATVSCQFGKPEFHVRAYLWLGQALESKREIEGACDAYAWVIEHWGRDPRSVTANTARKRFEAVCPKGRSQTTQTNPTK